MKFNLTKLRPILRNLRLLHVMFYCLDFWVDALDQMTRKFDLVKSRNAIRLPLHVLLWRECNPKLEV